MAFREVTEPVITTRDNRGLVGLEYAFTIHARYDLSRIEQTPRGGRLFQFVSGGTVSGPKLTGTLFGSGGDLGVIRADGVEDVNSRLMIRAEDGEWIFVQHTGYRRPDGYCRIAAYFDADRWGPYAWLSDNAVIATVEVAPDLSSAVFTYYQLV
jgi:hypothetical protein